MEDTMALNDNQKEYFSCLKFCPQGTRTPNCPFRPYDNLSIIEKYQVAKAVNDEHDLHHHRNCQMMRQFKQNKALKQMNE